MPRSVLVVDDHPIVRDGFCHLFDSIGDYQCIAQAGNGKEALNQASLQTFDLILVDHSLPDMKGPELIKALKPSQSQARFIMVSIYDNNPYVQQAEEAGVHAYLSKRTAADELTLALERIAEGEFFLSSDVARNLKQRERAQKQAGLDKLTSREQQVFSLLARGYCVKTAARELDLNEKTVHTHRANICQKLGVQSDYQLLQLALKFGLLELSELTD